MLGALEAVIAAAAVPAVADSYADRLAKIERAHAEIEYRLAEIQADRGHSVGCHTDNAKMEHVVIATCWLATCLVECPPG